MPPERNEDDDFGLIRGLIYAIIPSLILWALIIGGVRHCASIVAG